MCANTASTPPRRRPGGRSARVRGAALQAALDELVAVGRAELPVEGIARRPGPPAPAPATPPPIQAIIRAALAEIPRNPQITEASHRFWTERIAIDAEIITRATHRGEIPSQTAPRLVIESLLGPLRLRLLIEGAPPDTTMIENVVELV